MDCSEDAQRGMDGKADSPSSHLNMLFSQHNEKAIQEPPLEVWQLMTYPLPKC